MVGETSKRPAQVPWRWSTMTCGLKPSIHHEPKSEPIIAPDTCRKG